MHEGSTILSVLFSRQRLWSPSNVTDFAVSCLSGSGRKEGKAKLARRGRDATEQQTANLGVKSYDLAERRDRIPRRLHFG